MVEHKKTKPKEKEIHETVRPQNDTVGEMLRVARTNKNMTIEDVSASIHIRNIQLRAIEEGHIEVLPGMTYAVGFVRSYANFLGLNGAEVVHKFKAEHGHAPAPSKLSFPVPDAESRMPNLMIVGVGAFLAIVVLVAWTVYSNMHSGAGKIAGEIPPPPPAVAAISTTPSVPDTAAAVAPTVAPAPSVPVQAPPVVNAAASAPVAPVSTEQPPVAAVAPAVVEEAPAVAETPAPAKAEKEVPAAAKEPVINIKSGKGRIVLRANHSSWVQITGSDGVIYKKVLRPGEVYYVPDQPGLSLVTANAGGLDISVDGQKVRPLGKMGEIVRGIALDPAALRQSKAKTDFNQ